MMTLPRISPDRSFLATGGQVWATARAEFVMQWRRLGFWVTFGAVTLLIVALTLQAAIFLLHPPATSLYVHEHFTRPDLINLVVFGTTTYAAMFFGLVAALLVVDRLGRDQRLGMSELQRATPQGSAWYVLGKFLGNYVAVLLPTLLVYLLCSLLAVALGWPPILVPKFLLAFALVFVPASLAAVCLALLLASFLPLRVVQVGVSLLWIFFAIGPGWHTLVYTIFNPSGLYVYPVFFPVPYMQYTDPGFTTSEPLAILNIAVLSLTALLSLALTYVSLRFQHYREETS